MNDNIFDPENTFEVQVKPYCYQCEVFEPKVLKIHRGKKIYKQYIGCVSSNYCKRIEEYLDRIRKGSIND